MNEYTLSKADYLKSMCDEIGCSEINEALGDYLDCQISRIEFNKEVQTAFLNSVERNFRKKYWTNSEN